MTVESLIDLPDDVLYHIYQYLSIEDLKNLVVTNKSVQRGIYHHIYKHAKFIITFDDEQEEDVVVKGSGSGGLRNILEMGDDDDEEEDDDEYLISDEEEEYDEDSESDSLDHIDSDFYFDDFDEYYDTFYDDQEDIFEDEEEDADYEYESDYEYEQQFQMDNIINNSDGEVEESDEDINNGQDEIVIIRNSARWTPPPYRHFSKKQATLSKTSAIGFPIRLISEDSRLIDHIGHFKHFNVSISINNFNEIIEKLNRYQSLLKQLFSQNTGPGPTAITDQNKKVIKIFIKLNYTFQSFNDVKDCLTNVNRLIYYFDQSEEDQENETGNESYDKSHRHELRQEEEQQQQEEDDDEDDKDSRAFTVPNMYNKIQIDLAINHYTSAASKVVG